MIIYIGITSRFGFINSSLSVTYPPEDCPELILPLVATSITPFKLENYLYRKMREGEICTSLPFSLGHSSSIPGRKSLTLLAHHDFLSMTPDDLPLKTSYITLACRDNNVDLPTDGLNYLINYLESNSIDPKKFKLGLFIYQNTEETNEIINALKDQTIAALHTSGENLVKRLPIQNNQFLPFTNLANSYFKGKITTFFTPNDEPIINGRNSKFNKFLSRKQLTSFSTDLGKVISQLNTRPEEIPIFLDDDANNLRLLKSIIVTEWIMRSMDYKERLKGGELANKYRIKAICWRERINIAVWGNKWDKVGWMGVRAIRYLRNRKQELPAQETISVIYKRSIIITFFPLAFILLSLNWFKVSIGLPRNLLTFLSIVVSGVLGPLLMIDLTLSWGQLSLPKIFRYLFAFSYLFFGITIFLNLSSLVVPILPLLSLSIFICLLWITFPLSPKMGKLIFLIPIFTIPFSSFILPKPLWEYQFRDLEILSKEFYDYIGFLILHITELLSYLIT